MKKSNVFLQRGLFTEDTRAKGAFEYDVIIEPCFVMSFLVHLETSTSRKISPAQCAQLHDHFIPVIKVRIVWILKGSLDSIPLLSRSVKIQIMSGKVCLRCKGKTLLDAVNKLVKTKSLLI